uniref:Uncharacterized protein n=1 Tax=Acrobeloides nanus TaxID=290746 RepID=A0A914EIU2_9BILA
MAAYEVLIRSPDFDRELWASFLEYLEVDYIGQYRFGIRGDSIHKRAMWNVYDRNIANGMRTNNSEGFHLRINTFFEEFVQSAMVGVVDHMAEGNDMVVLVVVVPAWDTDRWGTDQWGWDMEICLAMEWAMDVDVVYVL